MKRFQRMLALMLAIMTILATLSVPALAASYKVATLKTGTWYKLPYYSDMKTIYKLKLTADSIVTISWKGNEGCACFNFYDNKACTNRVDYCGEYDTDGSHCFGLSKGTYYIQMNDDEDETPTAKAKFTITKYANKANYCRAKALPLKSGETIGIIQSDDYFYDRWYKITVPKKKTVTITTNDGMVDNVTLYDSKMKEISCTSGSKKMISEERIAKGTYFIRISGIGVYSDYDGNCIIFKWN